MDNVHSANIDRIKSLAKERGIKIKYICSQLGLAETYLSNCKNGKDRMTDERLYKIAQLLGTTYEYLTDQTDDPMQTLEHLANMAESLEERIVQDVMGKLAEIPEDRRETFRKLVTLPDEEFERAMDMLELLWKK